jgi:predicted exporter
MLALVLALLRWRIGGGRRLLWVSGSVAAALAMTVMLKIWISGGLSLFALMACILVAGLGLDYGLFYSLDNQTEQSNADTAHAVKICALSTFMAFLVLALSPIPVLHDIGVTVAAGVGLMYMLMRLGRRTPK